MPGKTARFIQVLVAVAVGALVAGGGFATAAALIGSDDVKDNSLRSRDVMDGTLRCKDLREQLCSMAKAGGQKGDAGAKGDPGAKGDKGDKGDKGVTNLEADGPYPGSTDLGDLPGQGDNSDDLLGARRHPADVVGAVPARQDGARRWLPSGRLTRATTRRVTCRWSSPSRPRSRRER